MHARLTLLAGLVLIVLGVGSILSRAPARTARSNYIIAREPSVIRPHGRVCQAAETLPRDTSAIRVALKSLVGPRVTIEAMAHGRVLARGTRAAGWSGRAVSIPLSRRDAAAAVVTICLTLPPSGTAELAGVHTAAARAARMGGAPALGRFRIEYLTPGHSSWWSLATAVARRMGLGHFWPGSWIAPFLLALMLATASLGTWLLTRELP